MSEFTVTLGGQTYTLHPLPIRAAKAWRVKFAEPFNALTQALAKAGSIKLDSGSDLAGLVGSLSSTLIGSTDIVIEMLFEYAPELAADRARIEEQGTDPEAMAAFIEVLRVAYPFGSFLQLVRNGQPKPPTSKK